MRLSPLLQASLAPESTTVATFLLIIREGSILGRVLFAAAISARTTPQWAAPTFEVIERCIHGLNTECCAGCIDNNRSSKQNPHRDKYLDFCGRWCGPSLGDTKSSAFDAAEASGLDEVEESLDLLADVKVEVAKVVGKTKRLVTLPVVPWVDRSRETFEELYGALLADSRARRVEDGKKHSLAEYVALHPSHGREQFTGFTNWCPSCFEYVEQIHGCEEWHVKKELAAKKQAAKLLAEQQHAAKMIDKRREARAKLMAEDATLAIERVAGIDVPAMSAGFQPRHEVFVGNSNDLTSRQARMCDPRPKSNPQRINELFEAKQEWERVSPTASRCLYCNRCVSARKGTKYCVGTDHRQRHWEQQNTLKETA
jgi:hypothetical protein